jgi:general secretion pathway protein A
VALRLLADRLSRLPEVTVGAINHPQSNLADLYRELGDIFAVPLCVFQRSWTPVSG